MTRRYLSSHRLATLAEGMTAQDRAVLATMADVRLASGAQLERLHFTHADSRTRRRALSRLVAQGLLARLPRTIGGVRAGSAGYLYVLSPAGRRLIVGGDSTTRPGGLWTPGWPFIAHALAVTDLYVGLAEARRAGRIEVFDFQAEPACWRTFHAAGGARTTLKPDARTCVVRGQFEEHFFVEVDRGTESPRTIERKLALYRLYWSSGREQATYSVFPWVLFTVPGEPRRDVIADLIAGQPASARALFRVAIHDAAIETLSWGRP